MVGGPAKKSGLVETEEGVGGGLGAFASVRRLLLPVVDSKEEVGLLFLPGFLFCFDIFYLLFNGLWRVINPLIVY